MKYCKVKEQTDYDLNNNCTIQTKYELYNDNNQKREIYSYDAYFNNKRDLKVYDENDMLIIHYSDTCGNTTYEHKNTFDKNFMNLIFEIFDV